MELGLVSEKTVNIEHYIVLFVIAFVAVHFASKYSIVSLDAVAFLVFAAMCYAGYLTLKSAKEIVFALEEHRHAAFETCKENSYSLRNHHISPVAFKNSSEYSKTKNSKQTKNLQTV